MMITELKVTAAALISLQFMGTSSFVEARGADDGSSRENARTYELMSQDVNTGDFQSI